MANNRKILYLDCFSGISGDMFLGALLDAGASEDSIRRGLDLLPINQEFSFSVEKTSRLGICGTKISILQKPAEDNGAPLTNNFPDGRNYLNICQMIEESSLSPAVRTLSLKVFKIIGEAEACIHGIDLPDVHFHEIGAVDSIVDIIGVALALENLAVDAIICSPLSDGSGTIKCRHGIIPVPVPAVLQMLVGTAIPYQAGTCDTELVTPTGMGLVKATCKIFGKMPAMTISKTGYGFGQREIGRLNALRVVLGEPIESSLADDDADPFMDEVLQLSCNLDNNTPEQLGYAAIKLMQSGAFDVAYEPLLMKKWRPGQLMRVIAPLDQEAKLVRLIFELTGTTGIRRQAIQRHVCQRNYEIRPTVLGPMRFKINHWHDLYKVYPEQDDLVNAAETAGISPAAAEKLIRSSLD